MTLTIPKDMNNLNYFNSITRNMDRKQRQYITIYVEKYKTKQNVTIKTEPYYHYTIQN